MMEFPKLIAHRGASAVAPENMLSAFKQAKFLGASMVEFDVMLTADKIPVVIHDENIKRTSNGRGLVNSFTFEQLQQFDAGRWFSKKFQGEKIPEFKSVLNLIDAYELSANVEIKPIKGDEAETVAVVMSYIRQFWPEDNKPLLISSFNYEVLKMVRNFSPEQPIGYLMHQWEPNWLDKVKNLGCVSVHMNQRIITQLRVDAIKKENIKVLAYTVNKAKKAQKLFEMGVDCIFSDHSDLLPQVHKLDETALLDVI